MADLESLVNSEDPDDRAAAIQRMLEHGRPTPAQPEDYSLPTEPAAVVWYKPKTWKRRKNRLTVDDIVLENARFDHSLKKTFGHVILWLVIIQVGLSNLMILCHFFFGLGAGVEKTVLIAWITGTVVESVGLMTVVTKYLFNSDKRAVDLSTASP